MAEPKEIVARRFPGTDTETDPLELGAKYLEGEGVMWTNDARDIYGDGSFVQRRPGVRLCTGLSAITSPPVYDLVRLALTEAAGIAGATGNDVLAGLYLDASNRATVILFTVGTLPAVTTATVQILGPADTSRLQRIVVADERTAVIRPAAAMMTMPLLRYRSATSAYVIENVTGPVNPDGTATDASFAISYKDRLITVGNQDSRYSALVQPSLRGAPWLSAASDTFTTDPMNHFRLHGGYATADRLYLGKSGEIHMLTGSDLANYRRVKNNPKYGIAGVRGGDTVAPDALLVFLTEYGKPSGATRETPVPRNVGILAGGELKIVGDTMLTDIRSGADARFATHIQAWSALRGALLIPARATTATAVTALFFSTASGGFWKWNLTSAVGACCLLETGGTMYLGTVGAATTEGLMYFDPALATDNGTAFTPRLSSPPFRTARKGIIDYLTVTCSQTSGTGVWTAQRRLPDGTYDTAVNFPSVPNSSLQSLIIPFTGGAVQAQYVNGWRVNMSTDGVGSKIHEVACGVKGDLGR